MTGLREPDRGGGRLPESLSICGKTAAPCAPAIPDKVGAWRSDNYPGISGTTRRLLHHWFLTDHRLPFGRKFAYHYSQRYAVETLVYLNEVAQARRQKSLLESYAGRQI
jgi:type III restriction enzyme